MLRHRQNVRAAAVLLSLSCLTTACGVRAYRLELPQRDVDSRDVQPRRVAVIVDKQFMPYKITFKYCAHVFREAFVKLSMSLESDIQSLRKL